MYGRGGLALLVSDGFAPVTALGKGASPPLFLLTDN